MQKLNSIFAADIPGYTPEAEIQQIYQAALDTIDIPGDIVEIGSWCGRSAVALAAASHTSKVHCIDLFLDLKDWKRRPDGNWESITTLCDGTIHRSHNNPPISTSVFDNEVMPVYRDHPVLLDYFRENMLKYNIAHIVFPHKCTSKLWATSTPIDFQCRLAFIDGGHSYEEVCDDIQNIEPFLSPGALILFDDVLAGFPGVDRAVQEMILNRPEIYTDIRHVVGRLLIAKKVA